MRKVPERFGQNGELIMDDQGREVPDPIPLEPPVGYFRQPSLAEQIREMVRSEKLRLEAEAAGYESFEEADDFDVEDDDSFDPSTPYENDFDPSAREIVEEVRKAREPKKETVRQDPQPKAPVEKGDGVPGEGEV